MTKKDIAYLIAGEQSLVFIKQKILDNDATGRTIIKEIDYTLEKIAVVLKR